MLHFKTNLRYLKNRVLKSFKYVGWKSWVLLSHACLLLPFFVILILISLVLFLKSAVSKQRQAALQPGVPSAVSRGPEAEALPPFHLCPPLECIVEETEGKLNELGQRISAIEKAQLQSLELIQGEPLTKDKIEELKKSREEQV